MGNRTSNLFTALHVEIDDPVERLQEVHRVTWTAKDLQNALGVETMEQWVEYSPPAAYRLIWRAARATRPPAADQLHRLQRPGPA